MMVVAGAMVVGGRWGRGWRWRVVGGRSEKFEDGWEGGGRGLVGEWDEGGGRWESGGGRGGEKGLDWVGWCGVVIYCL